jgi:hypothetical protein
VPAQGKKCFSTGRASSARDQSRSLPNPGGLSNIHVHVRLYEYVLGPTTGTNLRSHSITTFNHYDRRTCRSMFCHFLPTTHESKWPSSRGEPARAANVPTALRREVEARALPSGDPCPRPTPPSQAVEGTLCLRFQPVFPAPAPYLSARSCAELRSCVRRACHSSPHRSRSRNRASSPGRRRRAGRPVGVFSPVDDLAAAAAAAYHHPSGRRGAGSRAPSPGRSGSHHSYDDSPLGRVSASVCDHKPLPRCHFCACATDRVGGGGGWGHCHRINTLRHDLPPLPPPSLQLRAHAASIDAELAQQTSPRGARGARLPSRDRDRRPHERRAGGGGGGVVALGVPEVGRHGSPALPSRGGRHSAGGGGGRHHTVDALAELERLEQAYVSGRHRSPERGRPAATQGAQYAATAAAAAAAARRGADDARTAPYALYNTAGADGTAALGYSPQPQPRGSAGRRGSPGRGSRSRSHSRSRQGRAPSPVRTRADQMEVLTAAGHATQYDAAEEIRLIMLGEEEAIQEEQLQLVAVADEEQAQREVAAAARFECARLPAPPPLPPCVDLAVNRLRRGRVALVPMPPPSSWLCGAGGGGWHSGTWL